MTLALLGYAMAFARDVPWWDDWDLVPVLSGQEPASARWLWERHNGHRIPLPKLIHLGLASPGGADFRAAAFLHAGALSATAAMLLLAARRLRGQASWTDALFPILLLHWGQYDNLLWAFQIQFVLSTLLFCVALVSMVCSPPKPAPGRSVLVAICAVLLPLCGINGVLLAPALIVWLAAAAIVHWRGGGRRRAVLTAGLAALALVAVGAVCIDYAPTELHPPSPDTITGLLSAFLVLLMAGGPVGAEPGGPYLGLFILLVSLTAAAGLARALFAGRTDRLQGLALLAGFSAVLVLGIAIGWGRAGLHADQPGGITGVTRYVTLMAPLPCIAALCCLPVRNRLTPALLCLAVALLLPANTILGLEAARWRADQLDRLTRDAEQGVSPAELSSTYGPVIHAVDTDLLTGRFRMLQRAHLGPYRRQALDKIERPAGPASP